MPRSEERGVGLLRRWEDTVKTRRSCREYAGLQRGGEKEKVKVKVGEKKRRKGRKKEKATPCVGWSFSCRRDDRRACLFGGRDVTRKQTRQTLWHVT